MLIDSNILVYAINTRSPKYSIAIKFLQENIQDSVVAQQNILETLRILTHPKFPSPMQPEKAIKAIHRITDNSRVISPNQDTHHIAFELITKHNLRSDIIFDAYLAATALSNKVNTIATDNTKDFQNFGITVINPFIK